MVSRTKNSKLKGRKEMKTKFLSLLLAATLVFTLISGLTVAAEVTSLQGSGTAADPYRIGTAEELVFAAEQSNSTDESTRKKYAGSSNIDKVYYEIIADIDMNGKTFSGFCSAAGTSTANGLCFIGVIQGNGHVIKNLTITPADTNAQGGLINIAKYSAIANLGLENVTVNDKRNGGAFVGYAHFDVTLQSCYVDGFEFSSGPCLLANSGGLVGGTNNPVTLINCYSKGLKLRETATDSCGLAGYEINNGSTKAKIVNCYTTAHQKTISSDSSVTSGYMNVGDSSYQPISTSAGTINKKLTAADLSASTTAAVGELIGFVDDPEGGLPILAWQVKTPATVTPGFVADSTTVIQAAADVNGYPSFIVYGWLNNFNTDATGLEYGMKINGEGLEKYLPAKVKVGSGDNVTYVNATPVANGQFAIRVYIKGLTSDAAYTMTPYVGTTGSYTYGEASDEYAVSVN